MKKTVVNSFTFLTLCQQEIKQLIQLFQEHFQDVDIIIDGMALTHTQSIEQFAASYRAKSLIARGYERRGMGYSERPAQQQIELRITDTRAILFVLHESDKPIRGLVEHIGKFLAGCQQPGYLRYLIAGPYFASLSFPVSVLSFAQRYQVSFSLQCLLMLLSLLLIPAFILFFSLTLHLLKIDRTIFLLPGTLKIPCRNGYRETIATLLSFLLLFLFFQGILLVTVYLISR